MSLKISTEKLGDIINKINEIVGDRKQLFDEKKQTLVDNANTYADGWPDDETKKNNLMAKIKVHLDRHQARFYLGGVFDGVFQEEIYNAAVTKKKLDEAIKALETARDTAKHIVGELDSGIARIMTNVLKLLVEVGTSMKEVSDAIEIFEQSDVPNFTEEIAEGMGERITEYRNSFGIPNTSSLPGLWGGPSDPLSDLLNNTGAAGATGTIVAPSTYSISIPEEKRDYSGTQGTVGDAKHPEISSLGIGPYNDNAGFGSDYGDDNTKKYIDKPYGLSSSSNNRDEPNILPNGPKPSTRQPVSKDDKDGLGDNQFVPNGLDDDKIGDISGKIDDEKRKTPAGNAASQYVNNQGNDSSGTDGSPIPVSTYVDNSKTKAEQLGNSTSIDDNVGLLTGRTGTSNFSSSQFDTSHKSSLAGALGIVTGGSTFGMPSGIGGTAASGVDLFSGMNGLGGVNIPNVSIGGYNPYSINIGSGSSLNFSNFDSSNLYNNVNFYTTPGLDTIQSPNQLLEHLNSLPESVRKKIASMDLDNRAESAYYNSMSNEEFDEVKQKQITKFRSMTKEQIKERLKKQGYTDEEIEIIANNENIGVIAFLVGEQNVTMEALRRAITPDGVVLEEDKDERPSLEELVSGEAAAQLLNPYQDEEVRKAVEEYEYAKEKFNRAVSKSNASSKALKVANEKLRKTRIDIEQIDGKDINKWTKEHIVKYNDCVKIFMEEKENATNDLIATLNAEKEFQVAMEALKEAKAKFNKKMAEAVSVDPSVLLLIEQNKKKKENGEETEKEPKQEPFAMISKKMVMPDLQMHNIDDVEILEETGSLSASDKAVVEQSVSQSVETYQTEQPVVENKPAENVPKEETVGSMEINGKKIQITKPTNNFVEAPEKE
jgi:hypothetical protein